MKQTISQKEKQLYKEEYDRQIEIQENLLRNKIINEKMTYNIKGQSLQKLPNESDEDYNNRLISVNLSLPSVDNLKMLTIQKHKRELIRNLETLMMTSDAFDVANKDLFADDNNVILVNRTWSNFRRKLTKKYDKLDKATFLLFVQS